MEKWVNECYLQDYESGELHSKYCHVLPFKHAVLENIFSEEVIELLERTSLATKTEPTQYKGAAKDTDWYSAAFYNREFLEFFYGKPFRKFLNSLLQEELIVNGKSIPQLNVFKPGSKGIPVHTDASKKENIGMVTLIQLSRGYDNNNGGELIFHRRDKSNNQLIEFKRIKPIANTLIFFKPSENSYHSVSDMSGTWERRTIAVDWHTKATLSAKKESNSESLV